MRGSGECVSDLEAGIVAGSVENVIEVEFETPVLLAVENRGSVECGGDEVIGVGGACAI